MLETGARLDALAAGGVPGHGPHILLVLLDDYGWANAGWHRNYTAPGGVYVPPTPEVATPHMDSLVRSGIELDRAYAYKYCSPSRSASQSGRDPYHVNVLSADMAPVNRSDPESGMAGIPRSMTTLAASIASSTRYRCITSVI